MAARRSPESSDGPPKKKMRQGTHSCIECRRRKIKCLFQDGQRGTCNECYARGVSCVDQESAAEAQTLETRQSLRERVANLESLIRVIANKVELDEATGNASAVVASTAISPERHVVVVATTSDLAASEAGFDRAPIMSLFNNGVTTFSAVPMKEAAIAPSLSSDELKLREKLMVHLPSEEDVHAVLKQCTHWWNVWARMFPEFKYTNIDGATSFIQDGTHSDSILNLSKAILCLCAGLQQVDASFVKTKLKLPLPRDDLIHYYVSLIHDNVFSEDRYVLKAEGLEIAILLAKIDANAGRPRKAWLTYRRAISFALLQGFNRKTTWQVTSADPTSGPKRRAIFWALFSGDRYFSLLLGLPYSLSDQQCDIVAITEATELANAGPKAMYELSQLGGRLIERYQNPDSLSIEVTMRYDKQLQELRKQLPSMELLDRHNPAVSFEDIYDRSIVLTYFNYVRTLLHLPYMLKGWDRTYDVNRKISLESSREMLQAYICLRMSINGEYLNCRIVDFQVFLVCLVLIVNSLAFEQFLTRTAESNSATLEKDWDLIESVKNLLERAEKGFTGSSTAEDSAIRTLNQLLDCRYGCPANETSQTISIPYFGTITIRPTDEIRAAMAQKQLATPSQTTLSSCGSPASQPSWQQLPTPASMELSDNGKAASYVAFERNRIPMPSAYNFDALAGNGDFEFNNSIYMNDMVGVYDWLSMPVTFDTDAGWPADQSAAPTGYTQF